MKVIMWIARDANGALYMYEEKPQKGQNIWIPADGYTIGVVKALFPEVKWEDPEPTKVKIEIIK